MKFLPELRQMSVDKTLGLHSDSLDPSDVQPVSLTAIGWHRVLDVHRHDGHGEQIAWQRRLVKQGKVAMESTKCKTGNRVVCVSMSSHMTHLHRPQAVNIWWIEGRVVG